eukprot:5655166-Karenia_brevis.AAC.1
MLNSQNPHHPQPGYIYHSYERQNGQTTYNGCYVNGIYYPPGQAPPVQGANGTPQQGVFGGGFGQPSPTGH